ncbi:MAG: hypothetical protein CHACPFDD_03902 [Phycisphaerae bacterium]|nr:hypothetical protein [Phycisphaerae bacterium]
MADEFTWHQAIQHVLKSAAQPLHYTEITQRILAEGLRLTMGATPAATVAAQISDSIKKLGSKSPYVRVGKGIYALASSAAGESTQGANSERMGATGMDEAEEQYAIVTSFGMSWRRDWINWVQQPRLLGTQLGKQRSGATPVDFGQQRGIYLLYAGREVIYVGRTTDRGLGRRLYEHTNDRLSARWDGFSWFGLLPVSATGLLGELPQTYDASNLIPAFEAILLEALEPRQNRKRGDDLAAVEYIQVDDPEIRKKKAKAAIDAL